MNNEKPKCGHTNLQEDCKDCKALQKKYYSMLAKEGFKDVEYGLDTPELLYQPVNIKAINPAATAYYDAVWSVYHQWVADGRSERDCTLAELLAKQEGKTGTVRGIVKYLKSKNLKPNSKRMVDKTIKEINVLVEKTLKNSPDTP